MPLRPGGRSSAISFASAATASSHLLRKASTSSTERCSIPTKTFSPSLARMSSSSFAWTAAPSRFCVFWMRKTIRKVIMVVPVLMISCQVSEYPANGPAIAQMITMRQQQTNVIGWPAAWATAFAALLKSCCKVFPFEVAALKCSTHEIVPRDH